VMIKPLSRLLGYKSRKNFFMTYAGISFLAISGYFVRSYKFSQYTDELQLYVSIFSVIIATAFWESLRFVDRYLDRKIPFEISIPRRVAIQLLLGALIGIFVRSLIYYFGEPYLPFKLDELFLATTWFLYIALPTSINLGFFTVNFIERWKTSLVRAEKLEKEKSQVQFDNLKNQLNPHFLFNALTSLNSLIHEDQKLASAFLQQLSKVYRYVLKNKNKTIVTLDTELDFIGNYVSLVHTRFSESVYITFDVPTEVRDAGIVPVTLQILIENAIKHNVVDKARPLYITISISDRYLCVVNNLQIRKRVEGSNQQGLENLKGLYRFLTEKPVLIETDDKEFVVKVPLL
jgi:two-component system, LytTR family, sensor kinase